MVTKADNFIKAQKRNDIPDIKPGDNVRIVQKFVEGGKEKSQPFEGKVLAIKHNKEIGATITVRREIDGVGVEKIFPIHSPTIVSLTVLERFIARRAKLFYLRDAKGKRARLKKDPKQPATAVSSTTTEEKKAE